MNPLGSYLPLFIMSLLACFVPFLLKRLKHVAIPVVAGELIAGMIFGKPGFDIITNDSSIHFIANLGFAILMFLSGMEVDLDAFKIKKIPSEKKKFYEKPLLLGTLVFLATLVVNIFICYFLNILGKDSDTIMLILLLSTTSLGVVVPILKEKNIINSPYGQSLLLSALVADVATMLLLTIYLSYKRTGEVGKTALMAFIFLAFLIVYILGKKFIKHEYITDLAEGTVQIMIRASFCILLAFVLIAEILGVEIILGAFLAGLIMSMLTQERTFDLREKMDVIGYGFFIPAFFINAGASFDMHAVFSEPRSLYFIPLVLLMAFISKVIPALLLKSQTTLRNTVASGFLLSARLSLVIAASASALELGLITEVANSTLLVVAILTCTLSPMIFNKLYKSE